MPARDSVYEAISGLYDAALEPEAWPRALARLSRHCGSVSVHLLALEPDTKSILFSYLGGECDEAELANYEAYYRFIDPRVGPTLALPVGKARPQSALVPEDAFLKGEFFNDFYTRCGLRDQAGAVLERDDEAVVLLGLHRALSQTPYDEADMKVIGRFVPHLARAAAMQRRCAALEARAGLAEDAFDRLEAGVVLVDERGRVVFVNNAARQIMAQVDGLSAASSGLIGARAQQTGALAHAVAEVLDPPEGPHAAAPLSLSRPSGRRPYQVLVAPLPARVAQAHRQTGGALILITDPEAAPAPPAKALAQLYGLTPAEARVAVGLAAGQRLRDIAEARGVSIEAARWHLKQIFQKTGTHRQTELVMLLRGGPIGLVQLYDD